MAGRKSWRELQRSLLLTVAVLAFAVSSAFAATWTLDWVSNSNGTETSFRIERRTLPSGAYSEIGLTGTGVTTYVDTTAEDGVSYRYRVRARNDGGNSTYTNEGCAPPPCVPTVPTGVR